MGDYPCDNDVEVTDASCVKSWANRTTTSSQTQGGVRGVALEYLIDLANAVDADPWFCIQHAADDTYVRNIAEMIRDRLDSDRRVYVEFSNELWNFSGDYPQANWAQARGLELGLDEDSASARIKMVARRSAEIFAIFEEEFAGDTDRLVKILPGLLGLPSHNEELIEAFNDSTYNVSGVDADVFAIAAYFGVEIAAEIISDGEENSITPDGVLDMALLNITTDQPSYDEPDETNFSMRSLFAQNREVAEDHSLELITYEGGQHIVETNGEDNNETLGETIIAANRAERIYTIYHSLFDEWFGGGDGLFMHYSLIKKPSANFGAFGSLEHTDDTSEQAPKYRAILEYSPPD